MLTMSQINDIRDLSQKGYSISKISSLSPQPPVAKRRTSIVTPGKSSACPLQKHVIQGLYVNWREPIFSLPRCKSEVCFDNERAFVPVPGKKTHMAISKKETCPIHRD
ncbi:MAG: hypothetical protein BHW39_01370 [Firmicutes bacterium CAG:552_39_19]|nr:MAG: hypothetical protein BHW39_01370 [Firmicutes bacterium CAG:552_39_19]